jgi:hypothetical protein
MKSLRFLPILLATLLLAGCGTLSHQDKAVLQAQQVPPDVYNKMLYGDPLSLEDVITLSERAVPPGLITHYMDGISTVYILRKKDVQRLRSAGVDESVIAYMLSTAPQYGPGPYPPYPYPYSGPYPYGPSPYGYYDGPYAGPVIYVGGGYGRWGWGRGGWGHGGWHHH